MGEDGARRLHEDARRFSSSIEKLGRKFFEQALDQLVEDTLTHR
jgi:ABC-type long-subunit fatty acid transport system fused permease/ATPase subunit